MWGHWRRWPRSAPARKEDARPLAAVAALRSREGGGCGADYVATTVRRRWPDSKRLSGAPLHFEGTMTAGRDEGGDGGVAAQWSAAAEGGREAAGGSGRALSP